MVKLATIANVNFGSKGQVVIPRRIRQAFEIETGTRATVVVTPDGILLRPITAAYIRSLRGKYKQLPLLKTLEEMKREEKDR